MKDVFLILQNVLGLEISNSIYEKFEPQETKNITHEDSKQNSSEPYASFSKAICLLLLLVN